MVNELSIRAYVKMKALGSAIKSRIEEETGQTLAEYGLIMAVIAVAVVVAAGVAFRSAIIGAFEEATDCLSGATAQCDTTP